MSKTKLDIEDVIQMLRTMKLSQIRQELEILSKKDPWTFEIFTQVLESASLREAE